jgi:hypothetical protein
MTRLSRRDLRLIREAQGWEAAANAAGVRKTKKVVSKTGKTYYRPLTKNQRRYRISNIIQQKQSLRQKKKKPTAKDRKKLEKAIDKIKEARLAIPERDRVKAGRDLQIKDQIKAQRAALKRAEDEANKKQIQSTIDGLQEELQSDEAEEEVQRAHELAQDTDRNDDWNLFKLGYNATSKRQRAKFKKALKERLGDELGD